MAELSDKFFSDYRISRHDVVHNGIVRIGSGVWYEKSVAAVGCCRGLKDCIVVGACAPDNLPAKCLDSAGTVLTYPNRQEYGRGAPRTPCGGGNRKSVVSIACANQFGQTRTGISNFNQVVVRHTAGGARQRTQPGYHTAEDFEIPEGTVPFGLDKDPADSGDLGEPR
jgi:hypothetical protein